MPNDQALHHENAERDLSNHSRTERIASHITDNRYFKAIGSRGIQMIYSFNYLFIAIAIGLGIWKITATTPLSTTVDATISAANALGFIVTNSFAGLLSAAGTYRRCKKLKEKIEDKGKSFMPSARKFDAIEIMQGILLLGLLSCFVGYIVGGVEQKAELIKIFQLIGIALVAISGTTRSIENSWLGGRRTQLEKKAYKSLKQIKDDLENRNQVLDAKKKRLDEENQKLNIRLKHLDLQNNALFSPYISTWLKFGLEKFLNKITEPQQVKMLYSRQLTQYLIEDKWNLEKAICITPLQFEILNNKKVQHWINNGILSPADILKLDDLEIKINDISKPYLQLAVSRRILSPWVLLSTRYETKLYHLIDKMPDIFFENFDVLTFNEKKLLPRLNKINFQKMFEIFQSVPFTLLLSCDEAVFELRKNAVNSGACNYYISQGGDVLKKALGNIHNERDYLSFCNKAELAFRTASLRFPYFK